MLRIGSLTLKLSSDHRFLLTAIKGDSSEVTIGQLAITKGAMFDQSVRPNLDRRPFQSQGRGVGRCGETRRFSAEEMSSEAQHG